MAEEERSETAVIVFEGSINPAIITTRWLSAQDLISPEEAEAANVRFMDADFSRFDVSHFRVEARRDRITVASTKALEVYGPVQDFARGIFDVLIHTPISAVAISKVAHIALPGNGWTQLNKQLLGPGRWDRVVTRPDVKVLTVEGFGDGGGTTIEVTIEQSQHVRDGVYIVATERSEFPEAVEENHGARLALRALARRWDPWLAEADGIIEQIVEMS